MAMLPGLWKNQESTWLRVEVCRDFQAGKCCRPDAHCKFAHPPGNVEVREGRVTACYDYIKGRCQRTSPPCRYYHPLRHLRDQLFMNGRKYLALRNVIPRRMDPAPAEIYVLPARAPLSVDGPYLLACLPTLHSFLPVPGSIDVRLAPPQLLPIQPELNAQHILSYQQLHANGTSFNTEPFNGRNDGVPSSSLLCNVDLASHQARMSAHYSRVLLSKQLAGQNLKKS